MPAAPAPAPPSLVRAAVGLWMLSLLLRLGAIGHGTVISRDGIAYLEMARWALVGDVDALLRAHYPPGFPAALALLAGPFGLGETSGSVAAALLSSLLVPAVVLLVARADGPRAGLCAGLLAAALPGFVTIGAEVLSDGPYLAALAWTLVLVQRLHERGGPAAGLGAAALGGLAYLTRPEALVVLGATALGLLVLPRPGERGGARARLADLGWLLLPGLLVVVPYLLAIRAHAVLGGVEGAGRFKLTLKQDLPQLLAAAHPALVASNAARLLGRAALVLAPALPLALAGWAARPWTSVAGASAPGRRLGLLLALVGLPLLLAFAVVRPDPRFALQVALLAVPAAGAGLARALRAWPRGGRVALVVVVAVCVAVALRDRHERKATYRDVGALLEAGGARRVLAEDTRAAFYAGAEATPRLDPAEEVDPAAIVRRATTEGFDAVVLVARTPEQQATSRAVAEALGVEPEVVERAGAEPLHVFWIAR
ncbi:MAG: glycosyltransferase family 39 protein [Planctomycetes bacterium]|nr:glycosyltransferase family 39 protein [Planctomycetota bacterium]